jgi:hypothetical protein
MSSSNTTALKSLHVLLVTDDDGLAGEVAQAAAESSVALDLAAPHDDIDKLSRLYGSNTIIAVDGRRTFRRATRSAEISTTLNPDVAVVVLAAEEELDALREIRIVDGWQSPERLLEEFERARFAAWSAL